jgi:glycosyltransferase involved in cell wall biosynthesis
LPPKRDVLHARATRAIGNIVPTVRIGYIWARPIPSRETDTQQVMKTVDALAGEGADVDLIVPESRRMRAVGMAAFEAELRAFYSLHAPLRLVPVRGVEPGRFEIERPVHSLLASARLARGRYDAIYSRSRSTTVLCALRGEPTVFETYRLLGKDNPAFVRALAALARRPNLLGVITHSQMSADSLARAGFPQRKLATVHNGYDPEDMQPVLTRETARAELRLDGDRILCCYTGHVRARKGMAALLETAALAPEVEFLIAGGNPEDVAALAAECKRRLLLNVRLLGWRPAAQLRPLLYAADVLIIPPSQIPLHEFGRTVLPMKIFTYLAAGRPIVAPALPDLAEVLAHERSALLVPPDDAHAAAHAIRRIARDARLAAALARGALDCSSDLTWRARARKIIAQIETWSASQPSPGAPPP